MNYGLKGGGLFRRTVMTSPPPTHQMPVRGCYRWGGGGFPSHLDDVTDRPLPIQCRSTAAPGARGGDSRRTVMTSTPTLHPPNATPLPVRGGGSSVAR